MFMIYFQGALLGAAMILPLGPQNAFVLQQGSRKQFHLMSALLCALSDTILIIAGVFGGSALLSQSGLLMALITWAGVAFLVWYGYKAFRTAMTPDDAVLQLERKMMTRWKVVVTLFAVTWLNPHVYLDTFVVLGSVGGQLESQLRPWFTAGALTASFVWFFLLAMLAAWFSPILNKPRSQRFINLFVGCVMWFIAFQLAMHGLGY
ncbi:arginine exporter ArgO [Providencia alcalifaciens]|uniref:arginine exporter ArgO n=1 Tax=Providencia alcalifaciens TaxID=126385 RepID=UPI001CC74117|nr:arginine exporter ArgO [Providencia alcalifaciens]CAG9413533.1 Arginine exporter protein ArgO [Providencia alcalifaciens]CAG9423429.1 Arginine exporter protein ArgO [Providencia alcalifaciens]CAG9427444.1 Arginine exporter protein ArgO [Providencia alcalifaciens]CAG9428468.1 Arginine exporter protein ArgO [Providencia alcalifaciens]CAG9428722.1 Arginine exporter protein ArgO [Providencia alcalifaciens]